MAQRYKAVIMLPRAVGEIVRQPWRGTPPALHSEVDLVRVDGSHITCTGKVLEVTKHDYAVIIVSVQESVP